MEIEQDVDSNSSHQKAVLSSAVVIAGPSSLDLATNISKAMGVSLICPELRVFSDGESKIRIKEELKNKTMHNSPVCIPSTSRQAHTTNSDAS